MPSICHLTILNPAIHTRIFYKLASSQLKLGYDVRIYGQDEQSTPYTKNGVYIHPIPKLSRLSIKRLFIPLKLFFVSLKRKADIYTIHTPELLWVGWLLKKMTGCKVIYDVHEDYEKNIRYAGYYSPRVRAVLLFILRIYHRLFIPSLDAIAYAEMCYDNILPISSENVFFLRNTFAPNTMQGTPSIDIPKRTYLLLSGTISAQRGVWESLELWKKIRKEKDIFFVLAGFTYNNALLNDIEAWVKTNGLQDHFLLIGGSDYVPYVDILHLLKHCYASLCLYQLKPDLKGKVPTKFYETMAFNKPIIFSRDDFWNEMNDRWIWGVSYESQMSGKEVVMMLETYYRKEIQHPKETYSWDKDELEMVRMLRSLY